MERLQEQIDFIMELDKIKKIVRQTPLSDGSRKENDAEHSWHMAVMCLVLAEYANEPIDMAHTLGMILMHDVVEIDAGDTYAYDTAGNETKRERELSAADRIFHLLPEGQAEKLRQLWDEFEEGKTPEARFANALDKIQPILLNHASHGVSWEEHQIHLAQILKRNEKTADGTRAVWEYARNLIDENVREGHILP